MDNKSSFFFKNNLMSGIYIHIPFCKQACYYCDFHFSTSLKTKDLVIAGILKELEIQTKYLKEPVETIYFGGGTPSLLNQSELSDILNSIHKNYNVKEGDIEITLESNPDDLNKNKLKELKSVGINRLSIGLQSFHEPHLRLMNRAHSATESKHCVQLAQDSGFDNITIDLIYGIPAKDHSIWEADLQTALSLKVPHISSYCLTVEPKTAFGKWEKVGKFKPADDEFSAQQFEYLVKTLQENNFDHYEISNFAKKGHYSKHNSAYWLGKPYLGIGPSAHSFDGAKSRQFNISNNPKYYKSILEDNVLNHEIEILTREDGINEYLLITLRTIWGCDTQHLKRVYKFDIQSEKKMELEVLLRKGWINWEKHHLHLTENGKLFADQVAAELFM